MTKPYNLVFSGVSVRGRANLNLRFIKRDIEDIWDGIFFPTLKWFDKPGTSTSHPHAIRNGGYMCCSIKLPPLPPTDVLPAYIASILTSTPMQYNPNNLMNKFWGDTRKRRRDD